MAEELVELSYSMEGFDFKKKMGGWYNEAWGPIDIDSNGVNSKKKQVYKFEEHYMRYDLNLLLAVKCPGSLTLEFLQGHEQFRSDECYNDPSLSDDGSNFVICPCNIRPKLKQGGAKSCLMLVKSEEELQFAYKLIEWSDAKD